MVLTTGCMLCRAGADKLSLLQLHHFLSHLERRALLLQDNLNLIHDMFQFAGTILMETMLSECFSLVDGQMLQLDWANYPHSFLVYMQDELKVCRSVGVSRSLCVGQKNAS